MFVCVYLVVIERMKSRHVLQQSVAVIDHVLILIYSNRYSPDP